MLKINIKNKQYEGKFVLEEIDLEVPANGLYGLMGSNGVGKTTFLKCLAGLTQFEGSVLMNQTKINKQEIAWISTQPFLYEYLTAKEFKTYMSKLLGVENNNLKDLFIVPQKQLLKTFSTGMQKKAYLNSVFQKEYTLYLLDEVFNGLDEATVNQHKDYLIQSSKSKPIFIVSHLKSDLYELYSMIFILKNNGITRLKSLKK